MDSLHFPCGPIGCDGSERFPVTATNARQRRIYDPREDLFPAELCRESIEHRQDLDLGCACGRTSPWLPAVVADHLGLSLAAWTMPLGAGRDGSTA